VPKTGALAEAWGYLVTSRILRPPSAQGYARILVCRFEYEALADENACRDGIRLSASFPPTRLPTRLATGGRAIADAPM